MYYARGAARVAMMLMRLLRSAHARVAQAQRYMICAREKTRDSPLLRCAPRSTPRENVTRTCCAQRSARYVAARAPRRAHYAQRRMYCRATKRRRTSRYSASCCATRAECHVRHAYAKGQAGSYVAKDSTHHAAAALKMPNSNKRRRYWKSPETPNENEGALGTITNAEYRGNISANVAVFLTRRPRNKEYAMAKRCH